VADACLPNCTVSSQKIVKCRARLQKTITLMWERDTLFTLYLQYKDQCKGIALKHSFVNNKQFVFVL